MNDYKPKGIILQPGAFNPLHRMHKRIADDAIAHFPDHIHLFVLSSQTCDKGVIPMDELERRRAVIKKELYNGFITKSGLFIDHVKAIKEFTPPRPIVFAIGEDTLYRFFRDWENHYRGLGKNMWKKYLDYKREFEGVTWYVTKRETETKKFKYLADAYLREYNNVIWSTLELDNISSTRIREGLDKNQ